MTGSRNFNFNPPPVYLLSLSLSLSISDREMQDAHGLHPLFAATLAGHVAGDKAHLQQQLNHDGKSHSQFYIYI